MRANPEQQPRPCFTIARIWAVTSAMLLTSAAMLVIAALVGCGGPGSPGRLAGELAVTSFSARGASDDPRAPIRLGFSRPVVDERAVGQALTRPPVELHPPVRVAGHWADRQTLVLRPLASLRPSTRYVVNLRGDLARRAKKTRFRFTHRPLEVRGISGTDPTAAPARPTFALRFNQPVLARDVLDHCTLRLGGNPAGEVPLLTPDTQARLTSVALAPRRDLARGERYELRCAGLSGAGGNAPLAAAYLTELSTHPLLEVTATSPGGSQVSANEVRIRVELSTPVKLDALRERLSSRPAIRGLRRGWLDASGTRYTAEVDLRVSTRYVVAIEGALTDVFGQRLGKRHRFGFKTGDASPQLSLEKGIFTLERQSGGYPVWSRNVSRFSVACARVPKKRIVKLLTSTMDYDPWFSASSDVRGVSWKRLGLRPQRRRVDGSRKRNKWELHRLDLGRLCARGEGRGSAERRAKLGSGLFLAELRSGQVERGLRRRGDEHGYSYRYPFRLLANVTDLGVLLKAGTASGIAWVTRITDGQPVAGARVTLYNPHGGKRVFSGTTDRQGICKLPGTSTLLRGKGSDPRDFDSYRAQRMIALVEKGDELAVVDGNWQNGIQVWNFGVPVDRKAGEKRVRGFIQSDRGIYRPGERVHFKGLVREIVVGRSPQIPKQRRIRVVVKDPRGSTVYRKRLRLSAFGGFHFDLGLDPHARLGDYQVTAEIAKQTFRERFQVEEFRKVSYELSLEHRGGRHGRLGRTFKLDLGARYLFGAPVRGARVRWSVQRRRHPLVFAGLGHYAFSDDAAAGRYYWSGYYDRYGHPSFVADGGGETDDRGAFHFSFVDTDRKLKEPHDYLIQATVTDPTDQSVTKRAVVTAHRSALYVGLHPQEYVQAVKMPFAVNTVAVAPGGARVAAEATLSLIRERHRCGYERDSTATSQRARWRCTRKHEPVWTRKVTIPKNSAHGTERIVVHQPGEYIVRLQARDRRGNTVAASRYVWVIGEGEAFWSGDESARMSLIASKSEYEPGETARLVPRTSISGGTALLTLERNGVLEAKVLRLSSSGAGIEVPIREAHAPNVFASVALVRGRTGQGDRHRPRFKLGVTELKVSPKRARLKIEIEPERSHYKPGEPVRGTVRVIDADGKPVRAEVSLSAADEGVLQLIAYRTPDPMLAFYAPWGLGIDSATNWNRLARLNDPRGLESDEEGGDGGGDDGGQKVRSRFVSSAYWAPALLTDARGEAVFSFDAPDNLSAFRLMAVAADGGESGGSRFGSGEARITITKPLLAKPVLPRFLSAGDRVEVGVVVHNYSDANGVVTVRARARGVKLLRRYRRVRLRHGASARVAFPAEVAEDAPQRASLTFAVSMGAHRDALRVALPVRRPLVTERRTLAAGVAEDRSVSVPLDWSARSPAAGAAGALLAADSRLEITVDRHGLGELGPSLAYLIRYPYGCLEQTLSGLIPLTKVRDLARSLGLDELRGPRLRRFLRAGVAKVGRHQHPDGHFSLWPSGKAYPHLTAYALYGLDEARRAKVKVDADVIARGARALRSWVNGSDGVNGSRRTIEPGGEAATMAMTAYVLARTGKAETGLNARLFEARAALPLYGRAFLLRAMKIARAPADQRATLTRELTGAVVTDGATAAVDENRLANHKPLLAHYFGSNVRSSAIVLSALIEAAPSSPLIPKLAEGLKRARRNGRWYNTQDNIYALVAVADLARLAAARPARVRVALGGKRLARLDLRRRGAKNVLGFSRALSRLEPGELTLSVEGRATYAVRLLLARRATGHDRPHGAGFAVERQYLDHETGAPLTEARAGQLIKVRVDLRSDKTRHWVALVDPLPAGLEPVNGKLATSARSYRRARGSSSYNPRHAGHAGWTHQELRDDRVLAFADRMAGRLLTLEYLARATIPGRFTAAPAHAEAMYDPDVRGRSAAAQITVVKR